MATFDTTYINQLLSKNDFIGIAAYCKQFPVKDKTQRIAVRQQIKELERYGGIANAILTQDIDENTRNKIAFNMQRPYGQYGNNPYAKQVLDRINNIGANKNNKASYFEYVFSTEDYYNKFKDLSGIDLKDKNNDILTPYKYTDNGKPVIRIPKSAFTDSNFFNSITKALNKLDTSKGLVMGANGELIPRSSNAYRIPIPNIYSANKNYSAIPFESIAYDDKNNVLNKQIGIFDEQLQAYNLIDDAETVTKEITDIAYNRVIPSELMVSGFMCGAQQQIIEAQMMGRVDRETANFQLGRIKEYYDRLLGSISLTNYEVYGTEINPTTQNLSLIGDDQKSMYTSMLRAAIKENRVEYAAASSGGRVGTAITIHPKLDSNGKPEDNYSGELQLFVPDLFETDARKLINSDPEAKAMVEKAEHIAFQHAYNLIDGGRFENFSNEGATYVDDTGSYFVPSEKLDRLILRNEQIAGAIDVLQEDIYDNPNMSQADIENTAKQYAANTYYYLNGITTKEEMNTDETKQGINTIFQIIMNSIVTSDNN